MAPRRLTSAFAKTGSTQTAPSPFAMTQSSTTSASVGPTRDVRSSSSWPSARFGSLTSTPASYSASSPSNPLATTSRSELGELSRMSRDICLRCPETQHNSGDPIRLSLPPADNRARPPRRLTNGVCLIHPNGKSILNLRRRYCSSSNSEVWCAVIGALAFRGKSGLGPRVLTAPRRQNAYGRQSPIARPTSPSIARVDRSRERTRLILASRPTTGAMSPMEWPRRLE